MVKLSEYNNNWYKPGGKFKIGLWMIVSRIIFETSIPVPSAVKTIILKIFGAKLGKGIVLKPKIKIKYPWFLEIGNYSWIGESVWIDNLETVSIGSNCCISQGAYLLTGNHDYKSSSFKLILGRVEVGDGAWVGAKAIVCPGVSLGENALLAVGSVASSNLNESGIYQGNPAAFKRSRVIS